MCATVLVPFRACVCVGVLCACECVFVCMCVSEKRRSGVKTTNRVEHAGKHSKTGFCITTPVPGVCSDGGAEPQSTSPRDDMYACVPSRQRLP